MYWVDSKVKARLRKLLSDRKLRERIIAHASNLHRPPTAVRCPDSSLMVLPSSHRSQLEPSIIPAWLSNVHRMFPAKLQAMSDLEVHLVLVWKPSKKGQWIHSSLALTKLSTMPSAKPCYCIQFARDKLDALSAMVIIWGASIPEGQGRNYSKV
jgi:hypothetical protein